jgi:GNAT superfamily N-acetyltransferase
MQTGAHVRETRPADHEAIAVVLTRAYPTEPPIDGETVTWALARVDADRPHASLVAEVGGIIVGSAFLRGVPARPGLMLNLEVDPAHRRRGIGTRLLDAAVANVGETPLTMWTVISEEDVGSLMFAADHGFVERDRMFESSLDLTTFQTDAFREAREHALARGIRFTTLSAEDRPALRRQLYELTDQLDRDIPSVEPLQSSTYEEWVSGWLEAPHSRPDLLAIAFDGDRPVAVSSIIVMPDGTAFNHMSGVLASHRGQRLGLAVKVEALRLAQEAGIGEVRTDNHARNGPMLAINARLGYRPRPNFIELARAAPT